MTIVTQREGDQAVSFVRRHGVALLLTAAALAFLLPFGTVSCDNQTVHFTGAELATRHVQPATGHELDADEGLAGDIETDGSTLALMAVVFVAFGIGSAAWRARGGGFALAAMFSLLFLLVSAGLSMSDVSIEIGYWVALATVIAAVVIRTRARRRIGKERRRLGTEAPRPSWREWLRLHAPSWALGVGAVAVIMGLDAVFQHGS
jgi:hypothetical protein